MNRRAFLIASSLGGGLLLAGGAAWLAIPSTNLPPELDAVLDVLRGLRGKEIKSSGAWSPAKVFRHNAQSIEFSMSGFPQSKGAAFQAVVGKTAFALFSAKGAMRHGLAEPIPGAPDIPGDGPTDQAIDQLIASILKFKAWAGPLHPHFAYGELDKAAYEAAHAMHFANHMNEITLA